MKRRKIWIHTVFLMLLALSLVLFCFETERQYRMDAEQDDIFGGSFTVFVCLVIFFPVFSFEIELYRVVRYFTLCQQKTKKKTVINLVSLCFLPLLFFVVFILHRFLFDASGIILTSALIITPLHFLIMRILTLHWWSTDFKTENAGGTP